ncbi:hypothetical protein PpBr36_03254 [Pyricularia pennisetigena]|uniref:hypothetical protein n=1 Tax=Pyricularia pennisetigena TaxID=1578925 RepID=UPI0011516945|nr:hypothetical protein PpBr36_03254 [Pyricularia pennisetigena]TLS30197.1 hypothetical protein PpBr36_03254 [Pyricularia pennisetigena]
MKFWTVLTLAVSAAAVPFRNGTAGLLKHVGWRQISAGEMDAIIKNGGRAVQSNGSGARQIGRGLYITPGFKQFATAEDVDDPQYWDCAVTMDAAAWDGLKKIWLPQWFEFPEDREKTFVSADRLGSWELKVALVLSAANRKRFLTYLDAAATVDNTILFSFIRSHAGVNQALIPPAVISTGLVRLEQCAMRSTPNSPILGSRMGNVDWNLESLPGWGLGSSVS